MTSPEKIAQLREFGAATVYEAQGAKGALDSGMKPIDPASRLAGPALTVDARPADNLILHYAVLQAKPGDVLVVDAKGFMEAGPWGDVLTIQAIKLGIAGLVINGCVRDANLIIGLGFPVFCRGLSIKGTGKNQPGKVNVPVCIGDVVIRPGDIVVGDRDGLCVVAHEEVDSAIAASLAREEKEQKQRKAIEAGTSTTVELLDLGATLLGGTIVVLNKGGAGGNLGAVEVKRAAPDGYTIFYATSAVVLAPALYSNPGFDPYEDFIPISLTATIPLVLVVHPAKVPARTVNEFVAWGKAQGGKANYASSGSGALLHLAAALFLKETGWEASHIAYKGSSVAITDLLGGSTDFMFLPINEAAQHIRSGGLRALAVTSEKRSPLFPDLPTLREATGKTNMDMGAWQGVMVPRGTPADVVSKLSAALEKTLKDPGLRERLTSQGSIMLGGTQKEYTDYMKAEGARWAQVIRDTGAKAD